MARKRWVNQIGVRRQPESRLRLWWLGLPILACAVWVAWHGADGSVPPAVAAGLTAALVTAFGAYLLLLVALDERLRASVACPLPTLYISADGAEMREYGVGLVDWRVQARYPHGSAQWRLWLESRRAFMIAIARPDGWYRLRAACYAERRRRGGVWYEYHYYRVHLNAPRFLNAKPLTIRLTDSRLNSLDELRAVCDRAEQQQRAWGDDVRAELVHDLYKRRWRLPRKFTWGGRTGRALTLYGAAIRDRIERRAGGGNTRQL